MNTEFLTECLLKILASFVCGFILGMERKFRQQSVGMRTLILISVSSTLLSIASLKMAELGFAGAGDPTRIAAGVVSGIGFLGGGAIIHQGLNVKGLTSAGIIWTASALGLAIGAGLLIPSLMALVVIVLSLVLLEKVEEKWFPAEAYKTIQLVYDEDSINLDKIKIIIEANRFVVKDVNLSKVMSDKRVILRYKVRSPREADIVKLSEALRQAGTLSEFSITD